MAYSFDETNDYLSLADNAALTLPASDWAISLWVKWPDSTGAGTQFILSTDLNGATPTLTLRMAESTDAVSFTVRDDGGNAVTGTSSTTPGSSTSWQQMVLQREETDAIRFTLYVGGTSVASATSGALTNPCNSANPLRIGARSDLDAASFLGGELAELAKWDRALSSLEIARLAAGWRASRIGGKVWYLPLSTDTLEKVVGITVTVGDSPTPSSDPTLYDSFKFPTASGKVSAVIA